MAKKSYTVGKDGVEWASTFTAATVEEGSSVELDLEKEQETALLAAGWLTPTKGGGK